MGKYPYERVRVRNTSRCNELCKKHNPRRYRGFGYGKLQGTKHHHTCRKWHGCFEWGQEYQTLPSRFLVRYNNFNTYICNIEYENHRSPGRQFIRSCRPSCTMRTQKPEYNPQRTAAFIRIRQIFQHGHDRLLPGKMEIERAPVRLIVCIFYLS